MNEAATVLKRSPRAALRWLQGTFAYSTALYSSELKASVSGTVRGDAFERLTGAKDEHLVEDVSRLKHDVDDHEKRIRYLEAGTVMNNNRRS